MLLICLILSCLYAVLDFLISLIFLFSSFFLLSQASSLQFVRAEGFVFAHVADEGFIQSDAGQLLRYRKSIDADDILVLTDIKKKHRSDVFTF